MNITIKNIYISEGHNYRGRHEKGSLDFPIIEKQSIECVQGKGIVGDRFYDLKEDFKGQITFFDYAVYAELSEEIKGDYPIYAVRRNVITTGIDLNSLIGKEFSINGVQFRGSEECAPCYWMDEACGDGAHEFLKGRGGLRARILNNGELHTGATELVL